MIPKSFHLMGHPWTVRHVPGVVIAPDGDECKGLCDFDTLTISVNVTMPESLIWHTFFHEVMHAVYWSLGSELAVNEQLVDGIGGLLAQLQQTAEF